MDYVGIGILVFLCCAGYAVVGLATFYVCYLMEKMQDCKAQTKYDELEKDYEELNDRYVAKYKELCLALGKVSELEDKLKIDNDSERGQSDD